MIGTIAFNLLMVALAVSVAVRLVPAARIAGTLEWLHSIIGITPPAPDKAWIFALVWIASMTVIVDGLLLFLVFLTARLM
jgi:hypothetical protein